MSRAATEWRYEKLTWPETNDAVDLGKVCIVPCGAVEQPANRQCPIALPSVAIHDRMAP